jgi:hypothetical protein
MLRFGRNYLHGVERQINQLQAYVERMKALTPSPGAAAGGGTPLSEPGALHTTEELDTKLSELRKLLSEFKGALDFGRKQSAREKLESKLSSLSREVDPLQPSSGKLDLEPRP